MNFFHSDGPFQKYGTMIFDLLVLNGLVLSISALTLGLGFGASVTGLIYSIDRTLFEGRGYALENFKKSLWQNWKQATLLWLMAVLVFSGAFILQDMTSAGPGNLSIFGLFQWAIMVETVFVLLYAIPTLALLEVKILPLVRNSFILAHKHFLTTLTGAGAIALGLYANMQLRGILIILLVSGLGALVNKLVTRTVLVKYMTEDQRVALFDSSSPHGKM